MLVIEQNKKTTSRLLWEWGTAYDLFTSLHVLHNPAYFGLRGAWAAGVRSRLPNEHREFLEGATEALIEPFHWLTRLPQPKDSTSVLYHLGQIPPAERLSALMVPPEKEESSVVQVLLTVTKRGVWDSRDVESLRTLFKQEGKGVAAKYLERILGWWAQPAEFGERYLEALRAYQEVFFVEEERRICPALQRAMEQAQEYACHLALPALLEELSGGLQFEDLEPALEILMVPSYWITPRVIYISLSAGKDLFVFGARGPEESLVPGEMVPDALLQALNALSDPTRLRILRYLAAEPHTPAQLARRLRLRPPTVTHHLDLLRLAGLVGFAFKGKTERQYTARMEAVNRTFAQLSRFLAQGTEHEPTEPRRRNQVW
jgi:DNA-binding transcriptional ArsR family regulator